MVPYYVMVAVPTILSLLFSGRTDKFSAEKKNKVVVWFFFAFVLFFLMLRHETVGADIKNYLNRFKEVSNQTFKEIFTEYDSEYLYYVLNRMIGFFTSNKQVFLSIIAVICVIPVAKLYSKSENALLTIAIFLIGSNFDMLFSGLRQSLAIAIVAISYKYIKEKKFFKFLLIVLVAFFFHKSAFIALLLYPVYHMKITRIKAALFVPVIGAVFVFRNQIFEYILQFLGEYGEQYELSETTGYAMIALFTLFLVFSYVVPNEENMDKETIGLRNIMIITLIIQTFALASPVAMRMNYYNIMLVPLLLPRIINRCNERDKRVYRYIEIGLIVFFILYYFYRAHTGEDILQLYPYKTFWD